MRAHAHARAYLLLIGPRELNRLPLVSLRKALYIDTKYVEDSPPPPWGARETWIHCEAGPYKIWVDGKRD